MGLDESFLRERNQRIGPNNVSLSEWRLLLGPVLTGIFICSLERAMDSEICKSVDNNKFSVHINAIFLQYQCFQWQGSPKVHHKIKQTKSQQVKFSVS